MIVSPLEKRRRTFAPGDVRRSWEESSLVAFSLTPQISPTTEDAKRHTSAERKESEHGDQWQRARRLRQRLRLDAGRGDWGRFGRGCLWLRRGSLNRRLGNHEGDTRCQRYFS